MTIPLILVAFLQLYNNDKFPTNNVLPLTCVEGREVRPPHPLRVVKGDRKGLDDGLTTPVFCSKL